MTATYDCIATTTLSSAQASVTLSSIPNTYTDLVAVCNFGVNTSVNSWIRLNGDTGSNYSCSTMYGNGTSAISTRRTNNSDGIILDLIGTVGGSSRDSSTIIHLQNYTNTTTNKTVLIRSSRTTETVAIAGLWRNTSAINSVTFRTTASETFNSGATFTLYGIKAE